MIVHHLCSPVQNLNTMLQYLIRLFVNTLKLTLIRPVIVLFMISSIYD